MGVLGDKPTRAEISLERFGRHDADDRQKVAAAHLAFQLAMPMDAFGDQNLLDPGRDSTWLRKLFEHAVAGLYEVALPREHWRVRSGTKLRWQTADATDGMNGILPGMQTDIVLDHLPSVHRTVIDTKFTSIVKKGQYGQMKLKSGYIYQLYTYLRSQEGLGGWADGATGVLLHPAIDAHVDESVTIQGHRLRFVTVDLAVPALEIRKQLIELAESLVVC